AEAYTQGRAKLMAELAILKDGAALHPEALHEARWWECEPGNRVHCFLCPRHCRIHDGQSGFCFIRVNRGGKLFSLGYGSPAALQVDPIEKKTAQSFSSRHARLQHGNRRLQHGLLFLPELGHLQIAPRSSS